MSDATSAPALSRRDVLVGAATAALATAPRDARAAVEGGARPPVVFLGHGSPRLPIDAVRSGELRAWGKRIIKPQAILSMTPHFGSRRLAIGSVGPGRGMYNMPEWLAQQLPSGLDYRTPPSASLAARVEELLAGTEPLERTDRPGFDHTTWMPLLYLYPAADVPVLELAFPYRADAEIFALGKRLGPLRDEGVLLVASGQLTHNLAAVDFEGKSPVPSWSAEFDAWAAESLRRHDVDSLLDWRRRAPAAEVAHPDDGGHFRVLLFALGVLEGSGGPRVPAAFPVQGFESVLSKRGAQLA